MKICYDTAKAGWLFLGSVGWCSLFLGWCVARSQKALNSASRNHLGDKDAHRGSFNETCWCWRKIRRNKRMNSSHPCVEAVVGHSRATDEPGTVSYWILAPLGCLCDLSSVQGSRQENGKKWLLLILTFGERLWLSPVEQQHYTHSVTGRGAV